MYRNLLRQNQQLEQSATLIPKPKTKRMPHNKNSTQHNTQDSQSVKLHTTNIQRLSNQFRNRVFLIYSRSQVVFGLKFNTFHLAFALYIKCCNCPSSSRIPIYYLTTCCLFLAMKYEEIYPASLKEVCAYMRPNLHKHRENQNYELLNIREYNRNEPVNMEEYRHHELKVLQILGMNLNVQNAANILDETMKGARWKDATRSMGFYMLEIATVNCNIFNNYSIKQICIAICFILKMDRQIVQDERDSKLRQTSTMKRLVWLLTKGWSSQSKVVGPIFRKYQHQRFYQVSYTLLSNL